MPGSSPKQSGNSSKVTRRIADPKHRFRSGYNLEPVTKELEAARTSSGFEALAYEFLAPVVESATKFSPEPTQFARRWIVHQAIEFARKDPPITAPRLAAKLDIALAAYKRLRKKKFVVITHLSTSAPKDLRITLPNSRAVVGGRLPSQLAAAMKDIEENPHFIQPPPRSVVARVTVEARFPLEALYLALDDLDYLRGLWILWATRGNIRWTLGFKREPLAPVLVGPMHTVHHTDGRSAVDTFWARNGYVEPREMSFEAKWKETKKNTAWARRRIARMTIRPWIESALRRYALALDVTDWEAAFTKLWSLLEVITNTGTATYEVTIRRTLFLCARDRQLHKQILHHLRDFRNSVVHRDFSAPNSEALVCQLKAYVENVLVFLINRGHYFENIDEVGQFLDLPPSRRLLLKGARFYR